MEQLLAVMARLRGEGGCPWDREQTHASLRPYLIEEAYEAIEAINEGDPAHLLEELGDVLLQVVFHAQIAAEAGHFTFADVVEALTAKLIRRHPHVFGADEPKLTSDQVVTTWAEVKAQERSGRPKPALAEVAKGQPALQRAAAIQKAAAKVGFDWPDIKGPLAKVREEFAEFEEAYEINEAGRMEEELGDLLFAVVNVSRFAKVDPEVALSRTCQKFIERWGAMEAMAAAQGRSLEGQTLEELDKLWVQAKKS